MILFLFLIFYFITFLDPALAEPITLFLFGSAFASTFLGQVVSFAFAALFKIGTSLLQQALNKPKKPGVNFDIQIGDDNPIAFPVGTYATPGTRKYMNTWGSVGKTPNAYLVDVIQYSDLPNTGINGIWINGQKCTLLTAEAHADYGIPVQEFRNTNGADFLWIKIKDGTQTVADPYLVSKFGTHPTLPWTSSFVGRGCAHVIVTARWDGKIHRSGYPQLLIEPAKTKFYDIRKDSTNGGVGAHRWNNQATWEATDNPVVIIYNIIRGIYYGSEWMFGGQNIEAFRLPASNWIAAANQCDVQIEISPGVFQNQYRAGFEVKCDMEPLEVIEELLKACSARISESGGIFKILCGAPGTAVYSFTDENILISEEQNFKPHPRLDETSNAIEATYPEPAEMWVQKSTKGLYSPTLEEDDGDRRLVNEIRFVAAPFGYQVQQLMKAMIAEDRRFRVHSIVLPPEAWILEPLDVIAWTSSRNLYTNKKFLILRSESQPDGNQMISLREIDPTDYGGDGNFTPIVLDPPTNLDPPPQNATGFSVAPATIYDSAGNPRRPSIQVTIDGDLDDIGSTQVQVCLQSSGVVVFDSEIPYGDVGAPGTQKSYILSAGEFLKDTQYQVRIKYIPLSRRVTNFSTWLSVTTPNIGITDDDFGGNNPDVPTGLTLTSALDSLTPGWVILTATWNANTDKTVYYDLQLKEGAGNYISFNVPQGTTPIKYTWRVRPNVAFDARIRAFNAVSKFSAFSSVVSHTSAIDTVPPAVPTGLTVTAGFEVLWLEWNANTEADFAFYEIYMHTAASPAPSAGTAATYISFGNEAVITGLTAGAQRWFWIRAVDTSNNKSDWTASVDGTVTGITPIDLTGAIDLTSFAAGLTPIQIVATLPTTGNFAGRMVFLTTTNKLYRHTGSPTDETGFTVAVDGADIVANSITAGSIAAGAIGADQLAVGAVRAKHVLITDWTNLIADGYYKDGTTDSWALIGANHTFLSGISGYEGKSTALQVTGTSSNTYSYLFDVVAGRSYFLEAAINRVSATSGIVSVSIQFLNEANSGIGLVTVYGQTSDALNTWLRKTATGVAPAGAVKARLVVGTAGTTIAGGSYQVGYTAITRMGEGELIVDGSIQANHITTEELITLSTQIKDAIITNAKIVELSAAKLMAGTVMSGAILVGGRSLSSLGAEIFADDFSNAPSGTLIDTVPSPLHTWIQTADGPAEFLARDAAQSGPNVIRLLNYNWLINKAARIPYDPNKMYRIRVRVRRTTGSIDGLMYIGVQGLAADGVTAITTTGATGVNQGHWVVAQGFPSTSLPADSSWATYEGYIKGTAAIGTGVTNGTAGGSIAAPCQMQSGTRFISPVIASNLGGGDYTIQMDYFAIHLVDEDAANIVNAGTVKILPGLVEISGGTTLSDWRQGGDVTKIAGGSISTNTIAANKITVGARGVTLENIEFEHNSPSLNRVSWTAGTIRYINDAGVATGVAVAANAAGTAWSGGATVMYIYWVKGAGTLNTTNTPATAFGQNNIVLATYQGTTNLVSTYGRTIIDGSNIKTGTVTADRLNVTSLRAITATIGTFQTAASGPRVVISDARILIVDAT